MVKEEFRLIPIANKTGKDLIEQMNRTEVPQDGIAMWHLGQHGMAVKRAGRICYFDPYLSNSIDETYGNAPRNFPPPVRPEEVVNADYVFISHHHDDHLDPVTVRGIADASPHAVFICPVPWISMLTDLGIAEHRIIGAIVGGTLKLDGLEVVPVACKHEEYYLDEAGNHGYIGYVVNIDGLRFYHAGDTLAFPELVEELKPLKVEIACLPINGHDFKRNAAQLLGNMTFREAADLAHEIGADLVIPTHYDLFAFNTENPAYFVDYLHRTYPGQKFKMFVPGERMLYLSERPESGGF
jgi:L-ascorbate metabolism protein UlaG (beta-lactamase superfamily)